VLASLSSNDTTVLTGLGVLLLSIGATTMSNFAAFCA
jgi:hypothetical protein